MSSSKRVLKNSLWLTIQPLVLNVISLFVIGYIARTLGSYDYGNFIFAFGFVALFVPFTHLGVSAQLTREVSQNREQADTLLAKVLPLRMISGVATFIVLAVIISVMNYPPNVKAAVIIAGLSLVFNAVGTTYYSMFQGLEQMKFMAYSLFVSGLILTALSVAVLYAGFRLLGLTAVYTFGSFLGMVIAIRLYHKWIGKTMVSFDIPFWKAKLRNGVHFFVPGLVTVLGDRIGIIILSAFAGSASVGIFGAASGLIEKLVTIPDGVCTALFPAMAREYQNSKERAGALFQDFYLYLILLGLPIAVGATLLARPIIMLIYGPTYEASALILQILSWWLLLFFIHYLCSWTLSAIHQEKKSMIVICVNTGLYLLLSLLLIPRFQETGAALTGVVARLVSVVVFFILLKRYLSISVLHQVKIYRCLLANLIMGVIVWQLERFGVFPAIAAGVVSYGVLLIGLRVVDVREILKKRILSRVGASGKAPEAASEISLGASDKLEG